MRLTFQLPVPAPDLSPNSRVHWARKAAAVKAARIVARVEALRVLGDAAMPPPRWKRARYLAVLFHKVNRVPDPDNFIASLKAFLDGLADAGVVANDSGLWPLRPEFRKTDRLPRVEISIEEDQ